MNINEYILLSNLIYIVYIYTINIHILYIYIKLDNRIYSYRFMYNYKFMYSKCKFNVDFY